jgi:hypothetical protein
MMFSQPGGPALNRRRGARDGTGAPRGLVFPIALASLIAVRLLAISGPNALS